MWMDRVGLFVGNTGGVAVHGPNDRAQVPPAAGIGSTDPRHRELKGSFYISKFILGQNWMPFKEFSEISEPLWVG
jgi:hypothetical protein